jgi:hypothetical protein
MLPYIDAASFIQAPTGIDTAQLVPGGQDPQQSAELQNLLERASSWVDTCGCYQRLAATTDSEQKRLRPNPQGQLEIFTKNFPVISVLAAEYNDFSAFAASSWTAIDVSKVQPLERSLLVYDRDYSCWRGLTSFPLVVRYQYQNGFAHTTVATDAAANASTLAVGSTIGIGATSGGQDNWNLSSELLILDGANRELVNVTAINGTTLTLEAPLTFDHPAGALVTAVPATVQEATILAATWMVKNPRGDASFVMSGGEIDKKQTGQTVEDDLLEKAYKFLTPFRRVL